MRNESRLLLAVLAIAVWPAAGQQSTTQPQVAPTLSAATPPPPVHQGFFRPADDPSLVRVPEAPRDMPDRAMIDSAVEAANAATIAAAAAREADLERELDRVKREDERARAEAARHSAPMIVSPLDGTAPIVSPLGR